jgi:hypothetical protein
MNEVYDNNWTIALDTEHAEYDSVAYEYISFCSDSIYVELRAFFRRI